MAKIAILGFGTVGSGVYEVLCRNAAGVSRRAGEPVEVKYILDPKDFSNHPAAHLYLIRPFFRQRIGEATGQRQRQYDIYKFLHRGGKDTTKK